MEYQGFTFHGLPDAAAINWVGFSIQPSHVQTGSNINSAFHRSKVEKINLRIFCDLVVKILVGVKLVNSYKKCLSRKFLNRLKNKSK